MFSEDLQPLQVAWLLAAAIVSTVGGCKNLKLKFDVRKIMERELCNQCTTLH